MKSESYDVVVIGGGAAGLSAALVLGRARRRVAVIDAGTPRNAPAAHMHGSRRLPRERGTAAPRDRRRRRVARHRRCPRTLGPRLPPPALGQQRAWARRGFAVQSRLDGVEAVSLA